MSTDVSLLAAVVGSVCALAGWLFRPLRHAVTAVHEAGHTLVALLVGRSVTSVRLHRDSSGEAVSVGRAGGPGVVATLLAGYPAPVLAGLAGLLSVRQGWERGWLVAGAVVVCLMALLLRNAFGVLVVAGVLAVLVATLRWASAPTAAAVVAGASWFLVVGGLRSSLELFRPHVGADDAMALRRITSVPAPLWRALFVVLCVAGTVVAVELAGLHPASLAGRLGA